MPEKSNKTVFVLGAGASKASDFHLPVMRGFLQNLNNHDPTVDQLCYFCERFFPLSYDPTRPHISFANLNLEEVFTQLELDEMGLASIQGLSPGFFVERGDGWPLDRVTVKRQLLDYVRWRLDTGLGDTPVACGKHSDLLQEALPPEDKPHTILTLNYDLVADQTLWAAESDDKGRPVLPGKLQRLYELLVPRQLGRAVAPSLLPEEREVGYYLKLHGSLDWLYCPTPGCVNHSAFFPRWLGWLDPQNYAGDACAHCGTSLEWVIFPPTMKKSFERFPKLGLIWRLAHDELKKAGKIVFFGVSMAESDYYLHWLVRSSLAWCRPKPEVVVINPCREALQRTQRLTGTEPVHYENIDKYLAEQTG